MFCDFAVDQPAELPRIPFAPGRFVWWRAETDAAWAISARPLQEATDAECLVGEAPSNLIVGLGRFARGEWLAAAMPRLAAGYNGTPFAKPALLAELERISTVPAPVTRHIRALAESCGAAS